jgi:hypothetical protein
VVLESLRTARRELRDGQGSFARARESDYWRRLPDRRTEGVAGQTCMFNCQAKARAI